MVPLTRGVPYTMVVCVQSAAEAMCVVAGEGTPCAPQHSVATAAGCTHTITERSIPRVRGTNRTSLGVLRFVMRGVPRLCSPYSCICPPSPANTPATAAGCTHTIMVWGTPRDARLVPLTRGVPYTMMVCVQPAAVATLWCGAHGVPSPATTHMALCCRLYTHHHGMGHTT